MKLMFASDIHGNAYFCNKLKEAYNKEQPEKLILLGDLLYSKSPNKINFSGCSLLYASLSLLQKYAFPCISDANINFIIFLLYFT